MEIEKFSDWNPHTVMGEFCRNETKRRSIHLKRLLEKEHLIVNHYSGSWESYSSRSNDARIGLSKAGTNAASIDPRSYEKWLEQQQSKYFDSNIYDVNDYSSVVLRPWLKGFVDLVDGWGHDGDGDNNGAHHHPTTLHIASYLLQEAGIIIPLTKQNKISDKDDEEATTTITTTTN
jgi:hypothetical protein